MFRTSSLVLVLFLFCLVLLFIFYYFGPIFQAHFLGPSSCEARPTCKPRIWLNKHLQASKRFSPTRPNFPRKAWSVSFLSHEATPATVPCQALRLQHLASLHESWLYTSCPFPYFPQLLPSRQDKLPALPPPATACPLARSCLQLHPPQPRIVYCSYISAVIGVCTGHFVAQVSVCLCQLAQGGPSRLHL